MLNPPSYNRLQMWATLGHYLCDDFCCNELRFFGHFFYLTCAHICCKDNIVLLTVISKFGLNFQILIYSALFILSYRGSFH